MKIELEAKEGYEWVEVVSLELFMAHDGARCMVPCEQKEKYYIQVPKQEEPKYDYTDRTDADLLTMFYECGYEEYSEWGCPDAKHDEQLSCIRAEILRRMNKED